MNGEQQIERAMYTLEHYQQQADALTKQRQMIFASLEEHMRAKITITENKKQKEGQEILVPVGGNAFIPAKSAQPDKVFIGIGSDVIIEDTADGAIEKIDSTIKVLEEAGRRIDARISELERQIAELNLVLEKASAQHGIRGH